MTSRSPDPDPRDTFARDQAEAQNEALTREQAAWQASVQEAADIHQMRQAEVAKTVAIGRLLNAVASVLFVGWLILIVWAAITFVQVIR